MIKLIAFQLKLIVVSISVFTLAFYFVGECKAQNLLKHSNNNSKMNAKQIIVNAFQLAKQKKSFILEMVDLSEGLEFTKFEIIISASSGNLKMLWNYRDKDFKDKLFSELIVIGKTVYQRGLLVGEGWKVSKKDASYNIDVISDYEKRAKLIKNVQFVGKEEIDGSTADLYQCDFDINITRDKSWLREIKLFPQNKIKIWIGSNGLPMKIEYSKKFELSKSIKTVKTAEKFNFDEDVNIVAPNIKNGN